MGLISKVFGEYKVAEKQSRKRLGYYKYLDDGWNWKVMK
jgi:hypothetical protein